MHTAHELQAVMEHFLFLLTAHTYCGFLHSVIGHSVTNTAFGRSVTNIVFGHSGTSNACGRSVKLMPLAVLGQIAPVAVL